MRQASSAFPDLIAIPPLEAHKSMTYAAKSSYYVNYSKKKFVRRSGDDFYAIECRMSGNMSLEERKKLMHMQKKYGVVALLARKKFLSKEFEIVFIDTPKHLKAFTRG